MPAGWQLLAGLKHDLCEYPVMILVGTVVSRLAFDWDARSKGTAFFCRMPMAIATRENVAKDE